MPATMAACVVSMLPPVDHGFMTPKPMPLPNANSSNDKAAVTTAPQEPVEEESPRAAKAKDDLDTAAVFAKLKQLGGKAGDKDEE